MGEWYYVQMYLKNTVGRHIIFSDKWLEVYNGDYVKAKLTLHTSTCKIANTSYIYVYNSFWLLSQSNTVLYSFYQHRRFYWNPLRANTLIFISKFLGLKLTTPNS